MQGTFAGNKIKSSKGIHGSRASWVQTLMRTIRDGWGLEYLSVFISALSLTAIIIILHKADGIPLTDWRFQFSINTFVAIASGLTRAPLAFCLGSCLGQGKWSWVKKERSLASFVTFDQASRGPAGSISLLWHLKSW